MIFALKTIVLFIYSLFKGEDYPVLRMFYLQIIVSGYFRHNLENHYLNCLDVSLIVWECILFCYSKFNVFISKIFVSFSVIKWIIIKILSYYKISPWITWTINKKFFHNISKHWPEIKCKKMKIKILIVAFQLQIKFIVSLKFHNYYLLQSMYF